MTGVSNILHQRQGSGRRGSGRGTKGRVVKVIGQLSGRGTGGWSKGRASGWSK